MNSQSAFCNPSAFCIERIGIAVFVCSLHFVLNGLVLLCLFEQASSLDRNIGAWKTFSENILAATIDLWTVCRRGPVEKHNDRAMITLYQLKTNANALLTNMAACLWCSSSWSQRGVEMNPLRASSKLILTFSKWGGVTCETTSVHGPQCNFGLWNTTSVNICLTTILHSLLPAWVN